jgi:Uncharacterised nucleotidyltransferase
MTRSSRAVFDEIKSFSGSEWQGTLWWLSGSGLSHHFLVRLQEQNREDALPAQIIESVSGNYEHNRRRISIMAQEFEGLNKRLSEAGVECAAVRGFELAPDYCPDLSLRTWYTHEYVLQEESISRARNVVELAGFPFRQSGRRGELCFAVPQMQPPLRVEDTYEATFPRMVVLHRQIWNRNNSGINALPPEHMLRRLELRQWEGISFSTFADDDLLAFLVMDTFVRVLSYWCKLSWFFEIANCLRARFSNPTFWESYYARIGGCGKLPEISNIVFLLASHLFGVDLPPAVRLRTANLSAALRAWIELYGREWALSKYPGSKLSLLMQEELVDDQDTWKDVRRHSLFPFLASRHAGAEGGLIPVTNGKSRRNWARIFKRLGFHGPATYRYLREQSRWKSQLHQLATKE